MSRPSAFLIPAFLIAAFLCGTAFAQSITPDNVVAGAAALYRERVGELQSRFLLDSDAAFLARIQRIANGLIEQAKKDYPVALTYHWEIHASDDPEESASCMAGGKLLVGQAYVNKLDLNDAELAMLLSHEIAHAVLEHNFKEFQEALLLEPERQKATFAELEFAIDHDRQLMAKLNGLDQAQESEADEQGMRMAWRAGWSPRTLAGYFKKLARSDAGANVDHLDHPASNQRCKAARELADMLEHLPSR